MDFILSFQLPCDSGSQNVDSEPVGITGNWLKMQILRPHSSPIESGTPGGRAQPFVFW